MSLATLRTHLKADLVISGTDYDTQIDNAIRSAQRQLRGKRYWFLKQIGTVSVGSGSNEGTLPTNFSALCNFDYVYNGRIYQDKDGFDLLDYHNLRLKYFTQSPLPTSAMPEACAILGNKVYMSHLAADDMTINIEYYKKDVDLMTSDADTSVWEDEGYDVLRSLAMVIFKTSSPEWTLTQNDTEAAAMFMAALDEQHIKRFA